MFKRCTYAHPHPDPPPKKRAWAVAAASRTTRAVFIIVRAEEWIEG